MNNHPDLSFLPNVEFLGLKSNRVYVKRYGRPRLSPNRWRTEEEIRYANGCVGCYERRDYIYSRELKGDELKKVVAYQMWKDQEQARKAEELLRHKATQERRNSHRQRLKESCEELPGEYLIPRPGHGHQKVFAGCRLVYQRHSNSGQSKWYRAFRRK